jgi:adenylosuccinate synthase
MQSVAIIGAQWGDEGKGKITDYLGQQANMVIRYQGGNNAGHTIIVDGEKIVLHLIPSGILHPNCVSVIAHGVVFDPVAFLDELAEVSKSAKITPENLKISLNTSIITSYHKIMDVAREGKADVKIGTTGKGIGPAYEDKIARRGIKLKDLLDKEGLKKKLETSLKEKKILFENYYSTEFPSIEEEANRLHEMGQQIAPFMDDTFNLIEKAQQQGKNILL